MRPFSLTEVTWSSTNKTVQNRKSKHEKQMRELAEKDIKGAQIRYKVRWTEEGESCSK